MAKRIIERGQDQYVCTCAECATRFTYERSDVQHNYARGGDWVSCPHCSTPCGHYGARTKWAVASPGGSS
jgi:hypothetical protein